MPCCNSVSASVQGHLSLSPTFTDATCAAALLYFGFSVSVTLYPDFGYIFKENLNCHSAYQEAYNSIIAYLYFWTRDKSFLKA